MTLNSFVKAAKSNHLSFSDEREFNLMFESIVFQLQPMHRKCPLKLVTRSHTEITTMIPKVAKGSHMRIQIFKFWIVYDLTFVPFIFDAF